MNTKQKFAFFFTVLFATQAMYCMDVEQIQPDKELLSQLVKFHEPTTSSEMSPKPAIASYQKPGRQFIAKMDSFGLDRYFTFKTDAGIKRLVEGVQNGGGCSVSWFYHDGPIVKVKQVAANRVVITETK